MRRRSEISLFLAGLLLSACGQAASPAEALRDRRLAEIKRITDECALPASSLQLIGADELHFEFVPNQKYESIDCALRKLKNSDLRLKMGFVGNEAFEPEKTR